MLPHQGRFAGWASRWLTDELRSLSQAGDWEAAIMTFQQLSAATPAAAVSPTQPTATAPAAAPQGGVVQSNVFHYTTVVSGCARAGKWEAALATFSHMHRARVEPNVHTYTSVIHACTAGKRLDLAMRAYALMESSGVVANVHATTALVAACAKVGEWQRALDVLAEAERAPLHDPNVFTYTSAMDACRRAGQATAAVQVLRRMQERGVRANTVTFNTALNACAATRDWQLALTVLQMMKEAGVRPIPFTKVCVAEAFVGAPDAVRESVNVDELVGHTQPRPGRPAAADMGQIQDPPSPQP